MDERFSADRFSDLRQTIPGALFDIRYAGNNNFTGVPVPGYYAPVALLSVPAADALKRAAEILNRKGFRIIIYDAYRPRKAVEFFMRWAADADMAGDSSFYPGLTKLQILKNGYIAANSSHTRGSAVDLGLCDIKGCELDMGSPFDLFNAISHHGAVVPAEAEERRNILLDAMTSSGFIPYEREWWYYQLADEPYPDTCWDFDITEDMFRQ